MPHFRSLAVALAMVCLAVPAAARPVERVVEALSLSFTDFSFTSNFWDGFNPSATVGGPSPVSAVDLTFLLQYDLTATGLPSNALALDPMVEVTTLDLVPLSSQGVFMNTPNFFSVEIGPGADGDLRGVGASLSGGDGTSGTDWSFTLPGFLGGASALSPTGSLDAQFNSPQPFDTPIYTSATVTGSRQFVSSMPIIPLPAPVFGLVAGLAALTWLRAAGGRGAAAA